MKLLSIFSFCIILSSSINAQFIIAGQHNATDYFHDVIPDSTFSVNESQLNILIDIDNDSLDDISFDLFHWNASNISNSSCMISWINFSSLIAFSYTDSCIDSSGNIVFNTTYAKAFHAGDTIDTNALWTGAILFMARFDSMNQVYHCLGASFTQTDTAYIGVRMLPLNDNLYGWIKITNVLPTQFTLLEYACNRDTIIGINQLKKNTISIYPNPITDKLNITLINNEQAQLILYDITSLKLLQQTFFNSVSINTTHLDAGIYFYQIISGNGVVRNGKVVKE